MRHFVLTFLTLTLSIQVSLLSAQGPFGRGPSGVGGGIGPGSRGIGPGPAGFGPRGIGPAAFGPRALGPGIAGRPPMPPVPVPGVMRPAQNYARVPGVNNGPAIGSAFGSRSGGAAVPPVDPAPTPIANTTARTGVVQPNPNPAGVYRAGGASYRTAPPAVSNATNGNATTSDLRPGMMLPDGAVVVSVGQTNAPSLAGQTSNQQPNLNPAVINQAPQQPATPTLAPQSPPASNAPPATQSILEAEVIPKPADANSIGQPIPASDGSTIKKF